MKHDARMIQGQKHQRMLCNRPRVSKKLLRYINRRAVAEKRLKTTVKLKVKVSHNRPRWLKGFRLG